MLRCLCGTHIYQDPKKHQTPTRVAVPGLFYLFNCLTNARSQAVQDFVLIRFQRISLYVAYDRLFQQAKLVIAIFKNLYHELLTLTTIDASRQSTGLAIRPHDGELPKQQSRPVHGRHKLILNVIRCYKRTPGAAALGIIDIQEG